MNRFVWLKLKPIELLTPSVLLLIVANLVPLYGVFFLDWQIFPILLLFWMENVVVGIFNVFKMLVASPAKPTSWLTKVFMVPFFCFHYGMFTLVHGVFIFGFFGGYFTSGAQETASTPERRTPAAAALKGFLFGCSAIWISLIFPGILEYYVK